MGNIAEDMIHGCHTRDVDLPNISHAKWAILAT